VQAITCLIDVVKAREPLSEPKFTSVIWLRKNGHIELVQETNHRRRSIGDLMADSLHIEVFQSIHDAVPFSRFHRWIADPNGEFVGDMKGRKHCIRPSWDSVSSIAGTDAYKAAVEAIDWRRLRIEPVSTDEALSIIKKCRYREKLRNRIMRWILEGHYSPTLEQLSLIGLRRASQDHGVDFLLRYGLKTYYKALSEKVHCALIDRSVQSFERRSELPFNALRRKPASKR
jgi:hypothetical protein